MKKCVPKIPIRDMGIENFTSDPDKERVLTGKNQKVISFAMDLQYTVLGQLIIYRLMKNRDIKILITGKGKTTGTGKTTLGILLSYFVDLVRKDLYGIDDSWSAKEYSFMDVWDYLSQYANAPPGTPLITDELEYMADRRRHQTHENVKFSQAWSILRYRNIVTIGTAPGLSDLEKRVIETADLWLNVVYTGKANVYYITFDDFDWKPIYKRLRKGPYRESIVWGKMDNEDYNFLHETKKEIGVPGIDDMKQIDESDLNEMEREIKNNATMEAIRLIHMKDLEKQITQKEISNITGVSQQQVSKLKQELQENDEI